MTRRRLRGLGWALALLVVAGACAALLTSTVGDPPTPPATAGPSCRPPAVYLAEGRPDPCLTPGVARTSDPAVICVKGAATRVRRELSSGQWAKRRRQVERLYGLASNPGEIDHLLPLEGGGDNNLGNLWPQRDFKGKDQAEHALHKAICRPGVTAAEAKQRQEEFLAKWRGAP